MGAADRVIATVIAVVVWAFAGYAVASGPMIAPRAFAPSVLDVTAACILPNRN